MIIVRDDRIAPLYVFLDPSRHPWRLAVTPSRTPSTQPRAGRLRQLQLAHEPACRFCPERGIVTAESVVDHVEPHRGDWTKFVTGKLQSLCEQCHNSAQRQIELHGYRSNCDPDGLPTDPNHPFHRARQATVYGAAAISP